jgi:hypothetical protein
MMAETDRELSAGVGAPRPCDPAYSPFIPLLLLLSALVLWVGFQTIQLLGERSALATVRANQEAPIKQSQDLRTALDALAAETAKLADQGNPNAQLLVGELRKRGITINPNAQPAAPPAK